HMASGNYAKKAVTRVSTEPQTIIPPRATRKLQAPVVEEEEPGIIEMATLPRPSKTKALQDIPPVEEYTERSIRTRRPTRNLSGPLRARRVVVDAIAPDPIERHRPWL